MHTLQLLAMIALTMPASMQAQATDASAFDTRGFFFGAGAGQQALRTPEMVSSRSVGSGMSLQLGYGIRPTVALYMSAAGATMDARREPFELVQVDFGARYHFIAQSRRLVPFVEFVFSSLVADATSAIGGDELTGELEGTAVTIGGGMNYYLSPRAALTASATWGSGAFTALTATDGMARVTMSALDINASTRRVHLGMIWYPRRARR